MQRKSVIEKLRNVPLFAYFGRGALEEIVTLVGLRSCPKGQRVVVEGEKGSSMFVLLSGEVRVATEDRQGNEISLATLGEGEFFGEMALLSGHPRNATVTTTKDSVLLEISKVQLEQAAKRRPELKGILQRYYRERKLQTERVFRSRGIIERREKSRLRESIDARARVSVNEGGRVVSKVLQGAATELTDRGMCFEVEGNQLAMFSSTLPGTPLAVELSFTNPRRVLRLVGEVRWCGEVKRNMDFWFRLGIGFAEIGPYERTFLRRYLYGDTWEEEVPSFKTVVHELKM